ncbi:hypothetical protein I3842_05G211600 [Carya illinoinensis]|uniref:Uncharacterized protein n=1 Tax=Carya illinoinensis TaxID=32201 RepID=A0A922JRU3_CARIL|nr:hypothetical protein I3842_05G211600 [Carya illinoinensis]
MEQQAKLRKSMFRVHAKGLMQVILKDFESNLAGYADSSNTEYTMVRFLYGSF